jgi:hypothetical protein
MATSLPRTLRKPLGLVAALSFAGSIVASCATSPSATPSGAVTPSPSAITSPTSRTGAFVVRLGNDTVTVEQYTRTGNRIEGDILQRAPTTTLAHYVLTLDADGTPQRLEYVNRRPDGSPPPNGVRSVTVQYGDDTVTTQVLRDTLVTIRIVAPGAFPYLNNSYALFEAWLERLRATGTDSTTLPLLGLGAQQPQGWPLRVVSREAARVWYFGSPQHVTLDREGRVQSVDATGTTNKIVVSRVPQANLRELAVAFGARDAAGRGFGASASPRDTARATISGASGQRAAIWVDYGRPSLRGRNVWEKGVLGDTIWRTGANAATQLGTSADLVVAGTTVPAGTYTLWTHATPAGYELIFNKQTGQWGTVYDAARDLVRVPLQSRDLPAPVERFTITVDGGAAGGGVLRLAWGTKQLSLPFTVK